MEQTQYLTKKEHVSDVKTRREITNMRSCAIGLWRTRLDDRGGKSSNVLIRRRLIRTEREESKSTMKFYELEVPFSRISAYRIPREDASREPIGNLRCVEDNEELPWAQQDSDDSEFIMEDNEVQNISSD